MGVESSLILLVLAYGSKNSRDLPRLGNFKPPKKTSTRACVVCGKAPAGFLFIKVTWFRGDDVRVPCCKGCSTVPRRSRSTPPTTQEVKP